MTEDDAEEIVLPDGSTLPPGYVPGDMNSPEPDPEPPPDGMSWEDYADTGVGD